MEFPFWKKARNSAPNAKSENAEKAASTASSFPNTDQVASPELQAEINEALADVRVTGAEAMQNTIYDILRQVVGQVAEFTSHVRGAKVMEVFCSKNHNDHIIIAFADETALSIKIDTSTVLELDRAEGKR